MATEVRCPQCGHITQAEPEWRLVQCPKCGWPITRMTGDAQFD